MTYLTWSPRREASIDMDYASMKSTALPPEQYQCYVERTSGPRKSRREWTGSDQSGCCCHGRVRLSEDPLYLRLHWRAGPHSPRFLVGDFKLKLRKLLINQYIFEEAEGVARLKLYRGHDDVIRIKERIEFPGIPVGSLGDRRVAVVR